MQAQRDTKAINKPLTILGAEQKLFFTALIMDAAAFNLFGRLLGCLLVFGSLFLMAQTSKIADFRRWSEMYQKMKVCVTPLTAICRPYQH